MKKTRLIAICLSICVLLLSMTGCMGRGAGDVTSGDGRTITIWAWDDNFNVKAAKTAKAYFEKEHTDVTVNVVSMAQADIVQSLNTALSSSVYKGLPDIVLIEDYRIQYYLHSYPGELRDLSGIVDPADFMDYKLEIMTVNDKIYGVPFDSGVAALFYRTDYITQAGYTTEDMQNLTWDEYIEIGKTVKAKTGKNMLTLDPSDLGQIRMMLQSAGEWYVKEDGRTVDIEDNDTLKQAIYTYKRMIDANIVTLNSGWDSFVAAFQKGDVASVPTGCWIASSITAAEDQAGKWAIAPLPRLADNEDSVNTSNIGGASWYVLENAGNPELAQQFLAETFASNTQLMNQLVEEIGLVSTLKTASQAENYTKPHPFFSNQAIFKDFATWTAQVPGVNYGLYTYNIEDILAESMQSILRGADVDSVLKSAQVQGESIIIG